MNDKLKIYGTTIFIGEVNLETIFGTMITYVFQDVKDKKYIFALCKNIHNNELFTRVHSSCLTSETLRSMDCDCKQQLYGSLDIINKKSGILFYLMQSGRGASFISKARGCQLTQYKQNKITTFEAYHELGLEDDYRDFRNVKDILKILEIDDRKFTLITNNPYKINKLQKLINIKDTYSLEYKPNDFNHDYLYSKKQTGHILYLTKEKVNTKTTPFIKPFNPYNLNDKRFIHCASYYLPIKPINNKIIINIDEYLNLKQNILDYYFLKSNKMLVKFSKIPEQYNNPYWFKIDVYFDLFSQKDYILLSYGDIKNITPVVRFHSEFILNRFPVKNTEFKDDFKKSILSCIKNNSGIIVISDHNGDNSLISKYVIENNNSKNKFYSMKEYYVPCQLIKHLLSNDNPSIKVLHHIQSRDTLEKQLLLNNLKPVNWINLESNDKMGHNLINKKIFFSLKKLNNLDVEMIPFNKNKTYYVTGIGSSEANAKYFVYLCKKNNLNASFVFPYNFEKEVDLNSPNNFIVIISQGLSKDGSLPLDLCLKLDNCSNILLLTSVTDKNNDLDKSQKISKFIEKKGLLINYPIENEYKTLIRIIGPISCFYTIHCLFNNNIENSINLIQRILNVDISPDFCHDVALTNNIIIIVNDELKDISVNLKYKMLEGCFLKTVLLVSESEFKHGFYQMCRELNKNQKINVITINCNFDNKLKTHFNTIDYKTSLQNDLIIIELEYVFNLIVERIIRINKINQVDWVGKDTLPEII